MRKPKKPKMSKVNTSDCAKGQMHDQVAAKLLFTTTTPIAVKESPPTCTCTRPQAVTAAIWPRITFNTFKRLRALFQLGEASMSDDDLYKAQAETSRKRESEAIAEAYKYRLLWEAAASCLAHNAGKLKPRGADEAKVIDLAKSADHGKFWSGTTAGWIS